MTWKEYAPEIPEGKDTSRFRERLNRYRQQEYQDSLELMSVKMSSGILNSLLQGAENIWAIRSSWSGEKKGGEADPAAALPEDPCQVPAAGGWCDIGTCLVCLTPVFPWTQGQGRAPQPQPPWCCQILALPLQGAQCWEQLPSLEKLLLHRGQRWDMALVSAQFGDGCTAMEGLCLVPYSRELKDTFPLPACSVKAP